MTSPDHFEERLLHAILDNFDALTPEPAARRPRRWTRLHAAGVRRALARPRALTGRVAVSGAIALGVGILVAVDGGLGDRAPAGGTAQVGHTLHAAIASHQVLYRLADASVSAPALTGRYDIRSETYSQTDEPGYVVKRTLVVDTRTGGSLTYHTPDRFNPAAPPVLRVGREPTETSAFYASLPTDPTALRARLLTDSGKTPAASPTEDEFVYSVATDTLMSPVVPPALRAALYRVLAGCRNVTTNAHATDPVGRPAIEITQTDTSAPMSTYEDPDTGAVLAQSYMTGRVGVVDWEVYEPVRSADTIPADPYANRHR